jgi:hypothetical protein
MQVKGILFADYVRMLRACKSVDWSAHLPPEDVVYLGERIDPIRWYPMASFERLGNAILAVVAGGSLEAVRQWGRLSVDQLRAANPQLIDPRDPFESLARFRVLRSTFFDFEALEILSIHPGEAEIAITYHMGMPAEEAAAVQTMGFFERLLELSSAYEVRAGFKARSWAGEPRTVLALQWRQ